MTLMTRMMNDEPSGADANRCPPCNDDCLWPGWRRVVARAGARDDAQRRRQRCRRMAVARSGGRAASISACIPGDDPTPVMETAARRDGR